MRAGGPLPPGIDPLRSISASPYGTWALQKHTLERKTRTSRVTQVSQGCETRVLWFVPVQTLLNHILTANHGRRIAVIENEVRRPASELWTQHHARVQADPACEDAACSHAPLSRGSSLSKDLLHIQTVRSRYCLACPQFGEIDIDSELVVKKEVLEGTKDTVLQLSNGCLCCTVRDDLIQALNKLVSTWHTATAALGSLQTQPSRGSHTGTQYRDQHQHSSVCVCVCVCVQYDRRDEFDHIVIETTGLANPSPIISSFYMDDTLPDK